MCAHLHQGKAKSPSKFHTPFKDHENNTVSPSTQCRNFRQEMKSITSCKWILESNKQSQSIAGAQLLIPLATGTFIRILRTIGKFYFSLLWCQFQKYIHKVIIVTGLDIPLRVSSEDEEFSLQIFSLNITVSILQVESRKAIVEYHGDVRVETVTARIFES